MNFKKFAENLRDTLFPKDITCDICGAEIFDGGHFCKNCAPTVILNDGSTCPVCGRKMARPEICMECKADAPKFRRGISVFVYSGGAAKLLLKFKNGGSYLNDYLGALVADKAKTLPHCDCVTFVPVTKKRRRERGYNQGELLAEVISKKLSIPVVRPLIKKRDTPEQKALGKKERLDNLRACFAICDRQSVKGKTVLLADDVLTTGATADEVCRELLIAGAKEIYFATVASVEYSPFTQKTEK